MSLLGERYASKGMLDIWSRERKIVMERELWIAVMKLQAELGLAISKATISDYEKVIAQIDLNSIDEREIASGHDVKARIEEFNSLSGHEQIHLGMTSRDLTENIEILQISKALELIIFKSRVLLFKLAEKIDLYAESLIVARTHNVPAQLTTLGKKFATWAEEFSLALENMEELLKRLPLRGIHGAVGTNLDLRELLGSNVEKFNALFMEKFGFSKTYKAPSQIYPRSLDFEVIAALFQLAAAPSSIATNIRLMSGMGIATEGLPAGKTGSSAMPHKVNPRLSERVNSLTSILRGHLTMMADISGSQWNEGDVSCSALRRVALPDAFFATDAILETLIQLMNQVSFDEENIKVEIEQLIPELVSSSILMIAVKRGIGREVAHRRIKEHSLASKGESNAKFFELVKSDDSLNLKAEEINNLGNDLIQLAGAATAQASELAKVIKTQRKDRTELLDFLPTIIH